MEMASSYEKVTRNMVENLREEFKGFRLEIKNEFEEMKKLNMSLYNHLSNRLPPWATAIGAIGIAIISAITGIVIGGSI